MGFYDKHILPRLLNTAMGAKPITYQRKKVVPRAQGRVLEIGFGAGHNLPYYDPGKVERIWALEPSAEMRERSAERRAASADTAGVHRSSERKNSAGRGIRRHHSCHLYALHDSRCHGGAGRDAARHEAERPHDLLRTWRGAG